jgi:curved DNA-binding protein
MPITDPYATLGIKPAATPQEIKRAYRKLARRYHPDVSKEPDAEARFKEVSLAYEAIADADKRAAHDEAVERSHAPAPPRNGAARQGSFAFNGFDRDSSFDPNALFEALYAQQSAAQGQRDRAPTGRASASAQHARVQIDLREVYRGSHRTVQLSTPALDDQGEMTLRERRLEVNIPKGMRSGQHLRLAGQGSPGFDGQPAGDLYLEIEIAPHPDFRVDDRDVYTDLKLAPWEAALGASIDLPTPDGQVQLNVPPGSVGGGRLRLKGQGIPATPPGDLYAVLSIVLPPADSDPARDAYGALAKSFAGFNARHPQENHP